MGSTVASITPGFITWAPIFLDKPPITLSFGKYLQIISSFSTPFCKDTIKGNYLF